MSSDQPSERNTAALLRNAGLANLSMIVAASENGVIGRGGDLPWHLRADLQLFKQLTMGHCLIMGRKTYESIGRALPGRVTIVLTRKPDQHDGQERVLTAGGLSGAVKLVAKSKMRKDRAFVVGGAEIYRLALPDVDRLHLTRVHADVEGDTFLPDIDWDQWQLAESERHEPDEQNDFPFSFQIYQRERA